MLREILKKEGKSAEAIAFEYWLRTGMPLIFTEPAEDHEQKFNPYHDPRDGRFTFAPGGGILPPRASRSQGGSTAATRRRRALTVTAGREQPDLFNPQDDAETSDNTSGNRPRLIPAQYRPNPRTSIGGNGGPPLNDPMTLDRVFPGAATRPTSAANPGGAIIAMADNIWT